MSETMIERAADAIEKALRDVPTDDFDYTINFCGEREEDGIIRFDGILDINRLARAAIAAMRESTDAMLNAVTEEERRRGYKYEVLDPGAAWPIMIDAALKEGTE